MKRLVIFIVAFIFFAVLIMAVGSVFVAVRMDEKRAPGKVARSEVTDFFRTGNLVSSPAGWRLVYEEPGKPALVADLIFSEESSCVGIGPTICDTSVFTPGVRVAMEGLMNAEGKVIVTRVTPSQ